MEQSTIRSNMWNEAAKYGLIFGAISTAYLYTGHLLAALGVSGSFGSVLGFALWAAKFVGCIKLMQHVMRKFKGDNPGADRSDIFKLGALIAALSALVYSIVTVADMLYIFPEYYRTVYGIVIEEYAKILPAHQMEDLKMMLTEAPKFSFIGNVIYCTIFGTVLSFILSRSYPPKYYSDIHKPDEQ